MKTSHHYYLLTLIKMFIMLYQCCQIDLSEMLAINALRKATVNRAGMSTRVAKVWVG